MTFFEITLLVVSSLFILGLIFYPKVGLYARWRAWQTTNQREQLEDALKALLDQEHASKITRLDDLVRMLNLGKDKVTQLMDRLQGQGLVEIDGDTFHLTPTGERWALQVARAHRLWERYLADEARLPLSQVHRLAHRREHQLSLQEVDELDASLGFPAHDPHGDPIPDRHGQLAPQPGMSLTDWPMSTPGRIVHLEDEPPIAYAQILAEGLQLGQTIRILQVTPERILISDGENEHLLAPSVGANIFLDPVAEPAPEMKEAIPLSKLPDSQTAEVIALDVTCQGYTRRRLLDLGMTPGAILKPEMRNFFGDPRAYRVRGTLIALRREQAEQVQVKPVSQPV
jgi:DtxR family Mn-dependent transcriptional regulator